MPTETMGAEPTGADLKKQLDAARPHSSMRFVFVEAVLFVIATCILASLGPRAGWRGGQIVAMAIFTLIWLIVSCATLTSQEEGVVKQLRRYLTHNVIGFDAILKLDGPGLRIVAIVQRGVGKLDVGTWEERVLSAPLGGWFNKPAIRNASTGEDASASVRVTRAVVYGTTVPFVDLRDDLGERLRSVSASAIVWLYNTSDTPVGIWSMFNQLAVSALQLQEQQRKHDALADVLDHELARSRRQYSLYLQVRRIMRETRERVLKTKRFQHQTRPVNSKEAQSIREWLESEIADFDKIEQELARS